MKNKISTLLIVITLLAICFSGLNTVPAEEVPDEWAPVRVVATIESGPSWGYTLQELNWEGSAIGGYPPYTFDWDFDYDGVNFDVDVHDDSTPSWTYITAGEYNEPKDYTVALRVTDGYSSDIDTQVCTIYYSYKLEVWTINGPFRVKVTEPATFYGYIWNDGWVQSPSYDIDAEVWFFAPPWEKVHDWPIETYPGLLPYDSPGNPTHYYQFTWRTEEVGYHEFWIILQVNGVIVDAQYKGFWVGIL